MDMEALKAELKTTQDPSRRLVIVKQLGDLFLSQGNHVDALRAFESAAKFAPRDLEALRGLRLATIAAGQAKEALAVFQREMTMTAGDRERALLFRELGEHFQNRLNDFDNAQRAFAQARQLDAEVFSPAPAVAVAVAPEAAPVEAPPAAQEPPSPVDAAPTGAPSSPPPVPGVRPSSPRLAVRPPAKRSRAPLVLGGVVIVATAGAGGWFSMQGKEGPAAAPLLMPCSSKLERRADLLDPAGVIEQYECVNTLTSRRWKVRGGRVLEVAEAASGTLEGSIVLTPDPQTWIEGVNARGEASGTWRTWKAGLLDEEQDWVAGHRSGKLRKFSQDGGVLEQVSWREDRRQGIYSEYNAAGVLVTQGEYTDDKKSGVWTTWDSRGQVNDRWTEPRAVDAGTQFEAGTDLVSDGLFAGQTLGWWRIRYSEIALRAKTKPELESLKALTVERATLAGLRLNGEGQLEVAP